MRTYTCDNPLPVFVYQCSTGVIEVAILGRDIYRANGSINWSSTDVELYCQSIAVLELRCPDASSFACSLRKVVEVVVDDGKWVPCQEDEGLDDVEPGPRARLQVNGADLRGEALGVDGSDANDAVAVSEVGLGAAEHDRERRDAR